MLRHARNLAYVVFGVLIFAGSVALVRDTVYQGQDFDVFWRASRAVLSGEPAYDVVRDGPMVFKYPPWILPLFFPYALLPLSAAKWAWGMTEVASLAAVVMWVLGQGCVPLVTLAVTLAFWGIWAVHALDGQAMLPLLALALWGGLAVAVWALSAKIFSLFALLGLPLTKNPKAIGYALLACLVLSFPACVVSRGGAPGLLRSWGEAASSGGRMFQGEKVRGRDNQGFPALVLRKAEIPADRTQGDVIAFAWVATMLGFGWYRFSRRLGKPERWVGWLALSAAVHPLAWFHNFVLAFPLAVMSIDRALRSKRRSAIFFSILGTVLITVITRKTLGRTGEELELLSIKSWGVVFCALGLVRSASRF